MTSPRGVCDETFVDFLFLRQTIHACHDSGIVNEYDPATQAWTLSYLLTDHLSSIVAVTDGMGALISQQRYLPFGGERTDLGTISQTDYGYTGQRDNSYIKLMDYHFRWYSPELGRFISPDSIIPDLTSPQSLNRYSYVNNNPINFNDPTGHFTEDAVQGYLSNLCGGSDDDQAMIRCEKKASQQLKEWKSDTEWWKMISKAQAGDKLYGHVTNYLGDTTFIAEFQGSGNSFLSGISMAGSGYGVSSTISLFSIQKGSHSTGTKGLDWTPSKISWGGFYRPNDSGAPTIQHTKPGYEWAELESLNVSQAKTEVSGFGIGLAFGFTCAKWSGASGFLACGLVGYVGSPLVMDANDIQATDNQVQSGPYYFNFQTQPDFYNTWTLEHVIYLP